MLRGYDDVLAALRDSRYLAGTHADDNEVAGIRQAFQDKLESAEPLLSVKVSNPCDLLAEIVRPWAAAIAGSNEASKDLRCVFLAAANPEDAELQREGSRATAVLARSRSALEIQFSVAVAETLPAFLGNAWHLLLQNREELRWLRANPDEMPRAIEELLRLAGPSRIVFRQINGRREPLYLGEANLDPARFDCPEQLRLIRTPNPHLAFGGGLHACPGAPMIRAAALRATTAFVERFTEAELVETVPGRGSAIVWLERLVARL